MKKYNLRNFSDVALDDDKKEASGHVCPAFVTGILTSLIVSIDEGLVLVPGLASIESATDFLMGFVNIGTNNAMRYSHCPSSYILISQKMAE